MRERQSKYINTNIVWKLREKYMNEGAIVGKRYLVGWKGKQERALIDSHFCRHRCLSQSH